MQAKVIRWSSDQPTHRIEFRVPSDWVHATGQYLLLVHPEGAQIPFSIASAPEALPRLELHYKPTPGHPHSALMEDLQRQETIELTGPAGDVIVDAGGDRPLLGLAEETGTSQLCAVGAHFLARASRRSFRVIWGCPSGDQYCAEELRRCGDLTILDNPDAARVAGAPPESVEILLCGSPGWVYEQVDALLAQGATETQLRSDVFAYAPRG